MKLPRRQFLHLAEPGVARRSSALRLEASWRSQVDCRYLPPIAVFLRQPSRNTRTLRRFERPITSKASPTSGTAPTNPSREWPRFRLDC